MPDSNRRETGSALSDDQTWSYEVGSYCSSGTPNIVLEKFPRGSFATTQWAERRRAIRTKPAKDVLAGAPASA